MKRLSWDYEIIGFSRKVQGSEYTPPGKVWYLLHHGVTSPLKPGKVRDVFDASAEYQGYSLNKSLLSGPNLLNDTTRILTAFRLKAIGVYADIKAFFHQINVTKEDQTLPDDTTDLWGHLVAVCVFLCSPVDGL